MLLYHWTTETAARSIVLNGFRDGTGWHLGKWMHGVWLSDRPLDTKEGPKGEVLLEVELSMTEQELEPYEWIEKWKWKSYREFLLPAALVNANARVRYAEDVSI